MNANFHGIFCRSTLTSAAILLTFTLPAAFGDEPSAGDASLFERLDADENGRLSTEEVPQDQKRLFARLLHKADADGDKSLSQDEFVAALVPTRPEKPIEEKLPTTYPQANEVRYLLVSMDTSGNSWIEKDEVPKDLQPAYEMLADRFDENDDGTLDRYELSRGFPALGQLAIRYVTRARIDVDAELKKLEKSQGDAVRRFDEQQRPIFESLADPRQARAIFTRLDANADKKLEFAELPEPLQPQLERFMQLADRDGEVGLSEREFLAGAERLSRFQKRQTAVNRPRRDAMPKPSPAPDESMPAEDQ